ncbi:MAG: ion transporter [Planctomycetota bacterium]
MARWRRTLYETIFEAETRAGKTFDVLLLVAIVLSVLVVILESVNSLDARFAVQFDAVEWAFTLLFTIEYALRIVSVDRPLRYIFSFFGIVDLLSILPMYLAAIFGHGHEVMVIRSLRLLRMFRLFGMGRMLSEGSALARAVLASRDKIVVFLSVVLIAVVIVGAAIYAIEGEDSGFTSIPEAMYWAVVTMTTVGYGDIAPETWFGKFLASVMMVLGYSLIVVPTGIVTTEVVRAHGVSTRTCSGCLKVGHDADALHCKFCGGKLSEPGTG